MNSGTVQSPTDLGNAHRYAEHCGANLRYVRALGWLVWDGRRWTRDVTDEPMRCAKSIPARIRREALTRPPGTALRKLLLQWASKSESRQRLEAMIALARSEPIIATPAHAFDTRSWLLNVLNGTLDLRTGELRPHRREDLITKLAPTAFVPHAPTPQWQAFIERVLPDPVLRAFVARSLGSGLVGGNSDQRLHLWIGAGANGKSTLQAVLRRVLGDYVASADATTFLDDSFSAGPRPDLTRLAGVRVLFVSEIPQGRRLNTSLVKGLTGGDPLTVRTLYGEPFEFVPAFTPFLAANHEPVIPDQSTGMWRRIIKVPFSVTIPEQEQDPRLVDRLAEEGRGILWWLTRGCAAWQQAGLSVPATVMDATIAYREQSDTLGGFLAERCVERPDASRPVAELYRTYRDWADTAGERPISRRRFEQMLTERGFTFETRGTSKVCGGLDLSAQRPLSSPSAVRYAVPYSQPSGNGQGTPIKESDIPEIASRLGGS